jgi:hypothetical protein
MGILEALQQLRFSLTGVVQWLAAAGTVQRLTALGYDPVNMQHTLAAPTQALPSLSNALQDADLDAGSTTTALTVLKDIQVQLQAAGSVLVSFAIPHACNNPACGNMCGPSEAQLVGRHSCICAGCLTARYCGRACQRAVWRQHKPVCKALAAAAAAAAAAATPVGGAQEAASPGSGSNTGRLVDLQEACLYVGDMISSATTCGLNILIDELAQQATGVYVVCMPLRQAIVHLSADVLAKLLEECHRLPDSSSVGMLLQLCHSIVPTMTFTCAMAFGPREFTASTMSQQHSSGGSKQLPVLHAGYCKLLEDYVRMTTATAPVSGMEGATLSMLVAIANVLGDIMHDYDPAVLDSSVGATGSGLGALVAPLVAAGDASSREALQQFGLCCSWLKAYSSKGTSIAIAQMLAATGSSSGSHQQDVSSAMVAAVTSLLRAAMESSSGTHTSSSSRSGSRACTAAQPWLVLLGRCCSSVAVLVQYRRAGHIEA